MLTKKKKIFILTGMVALLVLTGVLNIALNSRAGVADTDRDSQQVAQCLIVRSRQERQATREATELHWNAIISTSTNAETIAHAKEQLQLAITTRDHENAIESMVMSQGIVDDVFVMKGELVIHVMTRSVGLPSEEDANRIVTIVVDRTGRSEHEVQVMPLRDRNSGGSNNQEGENN